MRRFLIILILISSTAVFSQKNTQQWEVFETSITSIKKYENPFVDVQVDVLFEKDGQRWEIPAFWDGDNMWKVRFAPPEMGEYTFQFISNKNLKGEKQTLTVTAYQGENKLYKHGMIDISENGRYFEYSDGTPFFWLADTWWKNLCKRLTWEGFRELAQDRKAKGFSVVQIVAGPYPDEGPFEPMWENEGGFMYKNQEFTVLNPEYWKYADRRIEYLIDTEISPAIVGAWGRADCDAMKHVGVEGLKRHWRFLIARYGAYPVFWILAGELHNDSKWGKGPWGEVGRYVREIDPYQRPITIHSGSGRQGAKGDDNIITFDMVGGSHDPEVAISSAVNNLISTYDKEPAMPVIMGEGCYEGHMQNGFRYVQRHMFWQYMLSGAAGHTYGAAGVWHASVEGDPGCESSAFGGKKTYDWTTWREGMNYEGATQVGLGKELLEAYKWQDFEPHAEWAEDGSFAAGIPGEVRFIYQPKRGIYNWMGSVVKGVETNVAYTSYYFDPATGRRFDNGKLEVITGNLGDFTKHTQSLLYEDDFNRQAVGLEPKGNAADWKDYGPITVCKNGQLSSDPGLFSILEKIETKDVLVSCKNAKSDERAGVILRFKDEENFLLAIYVPDLGGIYFHEIRNGDWGGPMGRTEIPKGFGPEISIMAAAVEDRATIVVSDGKQTVRTAPIKVQNLEAGQCGLFSNGKKPQSFGRFVVSPMSAVVGTKSTGIYIAPDLPSPQDWILVMERVDK